MIVVKGVTHRGSLLGISTSVYQCPFGEQGVLLSDNWPPWRLCRTPSASSHIIKQHIHVKHLDNTDHMTSSQLLIFYSPWYAHRAPTLACVGGEEMPNEWKALRNETLEGRKRKGLHEKGMGRGSSRQLCRRAGFHCPIDETGGQGPDGGRASLIGVTLRLSAGRLWNHMRPCCCNLTCTSLMICRLCIRATACFSMIQGMQGDLYYPNESALSFLKWISNNFAV